MSMSSTSRKANERNRNALMEVARQPGNDVCADCKSRSPSWASVNLGIFICLNCASIHRRLGTHITKVKSLSLDEWSKEQVEFMRQNGNLKSNRLYNPDESANPPPMNMVSTERDGELERFLRAKYQYKQFVVKRLSSFSQQDAVVPPRRIESAPTQLLPDSSQKLRPLGTSERRKSPSLFPAMGEDGKLRSTSQPLSSPLSITSAGQPKTASGGGVWDELISLQGPTQNSSLPLQFQPLCSASTPNTPLSTPMSMQYLVPGTLTGMPGNLPGNLFNAPNTTLAPVTQPPLEQSACVTSSSLFPSQAATYPLPSPSLFQWTSSQHLQPMLAPFCAPTTPQTSAPSTPLMTGHPLPTQPFVTSPHVGLGPTAFIQPQPQPPMEILNQDRLNEWQDSRMRQGF